MRRRYCIALLPWLLTARVSAQSDQDPAIRLNGTKAIELLEDVEYPVTVNAGTPTERRETRRLIHGTFVAEDDNEQGTYFRGVNPCIVWWIDRGKNLRLIQDGGIWISKQPGTRLFRLYVYLESENVVLEPLEPAESGSITISDEERRAALVDAGVPITAKTQTATSSATAPFGSSAKNIVVFAGIEWLESVAQSSRRERARLAHTMLEDPPTGLRIDGKYRIK